MSCEFKKEKGIKGKAYFPCFTEWFEDGNTVLLFGAESFTFFVGTFWTISIITSI